MISPEGLLSILRQTFGRGHGATTMTPPLQAAPASPRPSEIVCFANHHRMSYYVVIYYMHIYTYILMWVIYIYILLWCFKHLQASSNHLNHTILKHPTISHAPEVDALHLGEPDLALPHLDPCGAWPRGHPSRGVPPVTADLQAQLGVSWENGPLTKETLGGSCSFFGSLDVDVNHLVQSCRWIAGCWPQP